MDNITETAGYRNLQQKVQQLGLQLKIVEEECEEYDDEERNRYIVKIAGWS